MSTSPTLTFYCPACSARLTVPVQMAGVTGPCPTCQTVIRAPHPAPVPQPASSPSPLSAPQYQPAPTANAPIQEPAPSAHPEHSHPVRVEPRNFRQRDPHDIVAKPISEQYLQEPSQYRHPPPSPRNGSFRTKRILISLAALLLMGGVSAGLIYFLSESGKSASSGPKIREIIPQVPVPKPPDRLDPPPPPPVPEPPSPPTADAIPQAPAVPAITPKIPTGVAAAEALERFLEAKTLEERLPLIETTLPKEELEKSPLAGPLPSDPRISADIQETNRAGNWTDVYFNLELKDPAGKYHPYLILLRAHGGESPKVVIAPFLDTYGGRLAAYAATPSNKPAIFQVIASAVAKTTSDQKVPNHEQKLWVKLLPRDNEKEIAGAFFTKGSPIGRMLTDDTSGFRYGQAKPVRIQVRWNTEEDPKMPFLEAVDIKELRWNP